MTGDPHASQLELSRKREEQLQRENEKMKSIIGTQGRELDEARTFLNPGDVISENDIVQAVVKLNAEIYQAARQATEGWRAGTVGGVSQPREEIATVIGHQLATLLQTPPPGHDTRRAVLEVALQATITRRIAGIVSTLTRDSNEGGATLNDIYRRMRRKGNC